MVKGFSGTQRGPWPVKLYKYKLYNVILNETEFCHAKRKMIFLSDNFNNSNERHGFNFGAIFVFFVQLHVRC